MPDIKGNKVENFRLTKEQLSFQKKMKQRALIKRALQIRLDALKGEAIDIKALNAALDEEFARTGVPSESVKELPGMDFQEEASVEPGAINY